MDSKESSVSQRLVQKGMRRLRYLGLSIILTMFVVAAEIVFVLPGPQWVASALSARPTATPSGGGLGRIVFWGRQSQPPQALVICTIYVEGASQKCGPAPSNVANIWSAAWLPGSSQLVLSVSLTTDAEDSPGAILITNEDGSQPLLMGNVRRLDWSPDGHYALVEELDGHSRSTHLSVRDAEGLHQVIISLNEEPGSAAWSPDGTRLAYEELVGEVQNIIVASRDGTHLVNLTHNDTPRYPYQFWITAPQWLPDGKHLVYANETVFYLANADGSGQVTLFHYAGGFEFAGPYIAPDGRSIAFWLPTDAQSPQGEMVVINADGTHLRTVATGVDLGALAWNPDSDRILTTRRRELAWLSISDKRLHDLPTHGLSQVQINSWSPDGRWILFPLADPDGGRAMYRMDAIGSQVCRVTDAGFDVQDALWAPVPGNQNSIGATLTAVAPGLAGVVSRQQIQGSQTAEQFESATMDEYATLDELRQRAASTLTAQASALTATQEAKWTVAPDQATLWAQAVTFLSALTQTAQAASMLPGAMATKTPSATVTSTPVQPATQTAIQATIFDQSTTILEDVTRQAADELTQTAFDQSGLMTSVGPTLTAMAAPTSTEQARFDHMLTRTAMAPTPPMCTGQP